MGKTKYVSAFERGMAVGARHTSLSVSRTATLLGFFTLNSLCIKNGSPHKGIEAVLRAKGGATQY